MTVNELITQLELFEGDCPVRLQVCLNTSDGQVFFAEDLDTVCHPLDYGRSAGAVVLCNWDGPAVNLSDLKPID